MKHRGGQGPNRYDPLLSVLTRGPGTWVFTPIALLLKAKTYQSTARRPRGLVIPPFQEAYVSRAGMLDGAGSYTIAAYCFAKGLEHICSQEASGKCADVKLTQPPPGSDGTGVPKRPPAACYGYSAPGGVNRCKSAGQGSCKSGWPETSCSASLDEFASRLAEQMLNMLLFANSCGAVYGITEAFSHVAKRVMEARKAGAKKATIDLYLKPDGMGDDAFGGITAVQRDAYLGGPITSLNREKKLWLLAYEASVRAYGYVRWQYNNQQDWVNDTPKRRHFAYKDASGTWKNVFGLQATGGPSARAGEPPQGMTRRPALFDDPAAKTFMTKLTVNLSTPAGMEVTVPRTMGALAKSCKPLGPGFKTEAKLETTKKGRCTLNRLGAGQNPDDCEEDGVGAVPMGVSKVGERKRKALETAAQEERRAKLHTEALTEPAAGKAGKTRSKRRRFFKRASRSTAKAR